MEDVKLNESLLDRIEALIPHLRRFAWAHCGDRAVADEAVRHALLGLIQAPTPSDSPLRSEAFRLVRSRLPAPDPEAFLPEGDKATLADLPAKTREILFLLHVENFDPPQAGRIVGEDAAAVTARLGAIAEL